MKPDLYRNAVAAAGGLTWHAEGAAGNKDRACTLLRTLLAAVSAAVLLGPLWAGAQEDLPEARVMTFNVYWGGHDNHPVYNRGLEWLDVIKDERPDILVLQECLEWLDSESGYLSAYVDSINASLPEGPYYQGYAGVGSWILHVCLLSRHPVTHFEYFNDVVVDGEPIHITHVMIHAEIDLYGEPVHIVGVHLKSGYNRTHREKEGRAICWLLDQLPPNETVWVLGDFNCYSPVDIEDGSPTQPDYPSGASYPVQIGWEPIMYLLDRGYEDSFRTMHPMDPGYTQDTTEFFQYTDGPVRRIDYALRSPDSGWTLTSARIRDDDLGDVASDHYAVVADYRRAPAWADEEDPGARPDGAILQLSARPSPFLGACRIRLRLPQTGRASLAIFDTAGRMVRSADLGRRSGTVEWSWDGRGDRGGRLPAGVYLARAATPQGTTAVKIWKLSGN